MCTKWQCRERIDARERKDSRSAEKKNTREEDVASKQQSRQSLLRDVHPCFAARDRDS
jgi:hypothetical protein